MRYKASLSDILELLVTSMVFPVKVFKSIYDHTSKIHTLNVCDVFHAEVGFFLDMGGFPFEITEVDPYLNIIKVKDNPDGSAVIGTYNLYEPFFFHGTPYAVNSEVIKQITKRFERCPMIWLLEEYNETNHDDPEDAMERESEARIFFLTQGDFKEVIQNIHDNYVEPMSRLMQNFIEKHNRERGIFEKWDLTYKTIRHNKFGVYITNKGEDANLFVDKLSGIEVQVTLKILKGPQGCGCDPQDVFVADDDNIVFLDDDNESLLIF